MKRTDVCGEGVADSPGAVTGGPQRGPQLWCCLDGQELVALVYFSGAV